MAIKMVEDVLFPGIGVRIERVSPAPDGLVVEAVSTSRPGRCPDCRRRASRVHSSYQRRLSERPVESQRVVVRLRVRRYFCDRRNCSRKTFAEQIEGLTERYRRSSVGLKTWLRTIASELGSRAGERLCRRLRLAAGRTRLLGLLEAPEVPRRSPRVLGVDEFAFRKGCTYGTILVDVEAGTVVDVLPDRTSETFAAWLREHPGAEIICRDRASAYTRAVREAAPGALEVADRWHLLQNLSAAVEKTCHQHRLCLRKRADEEPGEKPPEPKPVNLPPPGLPSTQMIERTRHRYTDIHRLVDAGWTISAIARRLNLDRKTVRRFRDTDLDELLASAHHRRPTGVLEPFKAYLNARFLNTSGQVSGTRLFLEIRERGYQGSRVVVRRHLAALREGTAEPVRADIPSPRKITSWIMRPRETLTESQEERLLQVRLACPDIARACDLGRTFSDLVRHKRGHLLTQWIRQAEQDAPKPMSGFAGFLRRDLDAVTAGLTLPWSSGVVEGHVNRVKTLKRAMYGRASFEPGSSPDHDLHAIAVRAKIADPHQRTDRAARCVAGQLHDAAGGLSWPMSKWPTMYSNKPRPRVSRSPAGVAVCGGALRPSGRAQLECEVDFPRSCGGRGHRPLGRVKIGVCGGRRRGAGVRFGGASGAVGGVGPGWRAGQDVDGRGFPGAVGAGAGPDLRRGRAAARGVRGGFPGGVRGGVRGGSESRGGGRGRGERRGGVPGEGGGRAAGRRFGQGDRARPDHGRRSRVGSDGPGDVPSHGA
ncbi:hypothetical protein GCM10010289_81640 [Streptomyces violascens]|uniref:Transposase IS204/IS1001/IS1096/IS1165 DDE domain-containing protein n=1 Tax=Streptomyces violascens TaxID=67381 RepID=A0ABQ3QRE8_9ACTN|nr:hypothetical protein GCM10010289_81640 [Streptomyces violascens]GHI39853.1 hypothetical protein Sviol_42610 [Streptomyces violascens]